VVIGATGVLPVEEAARRAKLVRLVISDCDGVLTDAGVYYSDAGEAMKRFSIRDGMGVERLRNAGVASAIMTGERSKSVQHRAEKLSIRVYLGVKDKASALDDVLREHGIGAEAAAYIGDDVNDLPAMQRIGIAGLLGAPADAMPTVRAAAHFVTHAVGGHGAFREFAEWILTLRMG
jgi:3-deoxy-D-manno-octulosonate 8-phosphate phosphatase (KDO 8-P phosphatase)